MSAVRRRWSLVEADLGEAVGHEQALRRPVLIVSNEAFNRTSGLLTVLPVTSVKPGRSPHPFEILLPVGAAGNPLDSIILPHQIRTISAGRLQRVYGRLGDPSLRREVAEKVLRHLEFLDPREVEEEP
jgi:mRNA interferase MazF